MCGGERQREGGVHSSQADRGYVHGQGSFMHKFGALYLVGGVF